MKPSFPLKVIFHEDGEAWIISDEEDAACTLEWFDSDNPDENASVTDSMGRKVRLVVDELVLKKCELVE